MNKLLLLTALATLTVPYPAFSAGDGHGHKQEIEQSNGQKYDETPKTDEHADHGDEEHGAEGGKESGAEIDLTPENIKMAGVVVSPLILQKLGDEIKAPGEVTFNLYLSETITPRIEAQVIKRHAKMGDKVKSGQPLVTLSSVEMAEAVGEMLVAHKEWKRVKQLGSAAVSAKRYNQAKIANDQSLAKVLAYGMTKEQVKELLKTENMKNIGEFQLLATKEGVIVSDNFIEGELVEPGTVLFDIVNEASLWVESKLSPELANDVNVGDMVRINVGNSDWVLGKVIQKHHLLDKETRTIGIRIEVDNKDYKLHSGMYVDTIILSGGDKKYLTVPTESILRSPDGDFVVFVEEKQGEFKPQEVEIIKKVGDFVAIKGIPAGTKIVTKGAFFVQSELAKSGFAVHNH